MKLEESSCRRSMVVVNIKKLRLEGLAYDTSSKVKEGGFGCFYDLFTLFVNICFLPFSLFVCFSCPCIAFSCSFFLSILWYVLVAWPCLINNISLCWF